MKTFLLMLFTTVFHSFSNCADSDYIRCPLEWVSMGNGDIPPKSSIAVVTTTGTTNFIIRAKIGANYNLGRYDSGKGLVVNGEIGITVNFYDILTNPNNCVIKWKMGNTNGVHQVPAEPNSRKYVGRNTLRIVVGETKFTYLSGQVENNEIKIPRKAGDQVEISSMFEVLEAYHRGLNLQMSNFIFESDLFTGGNEFVGIDMIKNHGDATIKQTVRQTKRLLTRTTISNTKTWGHTFNIGISVQPSFDVPFPYPEITNETIPMEGPGISADYTVERESERTEEKIEEKELIVEVTREVEVPPYTAVQICSTVMVKDNFVTNYVARGQYTAKGLPVGEILAILRADGKIGIVQGNAVIVEETGQFGGTVVLSTKFIVSLMDDSNGCGAISTEIANLKRAKAFKRISAEKEKRWNMKIHRMLATH